MLLDAKRFLVAVSLYRAGAARPRAAAVGCFIGRLYPKAPDGSGASSGEYGQTGFRHRIRPPASRNDTFLLSLMPRRPFFLSASSRRGSSFLLAAKEPSSVPRAETACGLCRGSARKTAGQSRQRTDAAGECQSSLLDWPRRQEEGEAKLPPAGFALSGVRAFSAAPSRQNTTLLGMLSRMEKIVSLVSGPEPAGCLG